MKFPLRSDGALAKAASVAARHPSYRIEGENGSARVGVELTLPDEWRPVDELRGYLRGEGQAEYAADGVVVGAEELFGGLSCFMRKQRSGTPAREWCTPQQLSGKQLFSCRQIRVYGDDHGPPSAWYSFWNSGADGDCEGY